MLSKIGASSVLRRRHFVVARLDRHAHLVELGLDFRHVVEHALGDGAEVLILELLALGRARPEQRAAGVDEVGPVVIEVAVDQEILLLGAAGGGHARGRHAEEIERARRLGGERLHRTQQRRLLVERLAGPAHERRRDDQRRRVAVHEQPRRAARIPRRVATRLEGAAHAARREARGIGLAAHEFLAAEFGHGAAVDGGRVERVVLLGGDAGHGLEPVGVVRCPVFHRPVLQRRGHGVGRGHLEWRALGDRVAERLVHRLRQSGLLHGLVEDQRPEDVGHDGRLLHGSALMHRPAAHVVDGGAQRVRSHGYGSLFSSA